MSNSNPYYTHPYLSNSDLTKLKHEISGADARDYHRALREGSILDAVITQPERLPELKPTDEELEWGKRGFKIFITDPFCLQLHRTSRKQHEFYRENVRFNYNGVEFYRDCKCMYDGTNAPVLGWDVKKTVATTQNGFIDACHFFDYFRARAWYMNLSGLTKDMIIGVNVDRDRVFKIPITRMDKFFILGKQQYCELAYKHWALKGNNYERKII